MTHTCNPSAREAKETRSRRFTGHPIKRSQWIPGPSERHWKRIHEGWLLQMHIHAYTPAHTWINPHTQAHMPMYSPTHRQTDTDRMTECWFYFLWTEAHLKRWKQWGAGWGGGLIATHGLGDVGAWAAAGAHVWIHGPDAATVCVDAYDLLSPKAKRIELYRFGPAPHWLQH